MPADVDSFRRYFDEVVRNQLEDNAVVRDLLGPAVLNLPAPTPVIPEPLWRALWLPVAYAYTRATVALLPEAYAARLGLSPSRLQSWGTQFVARAMHVGSGLLPTGLRYLPKAAVAVLVGRHHRPVEPPHLLAQIIDRVPREPIAEDAEAYLAMVEAVLHSRMVTDAEVETLCVVISELGLEPAQVRQLHRDYLAALTKVAVDDGTMTNTERDALDAVAGLLEQVEAATTRVPAGL
jgi:hypothetical protein